MRDWLAKFKISCALDADGQMPENKDRNFHRSDEFQQFMKQTTALEAAFKATVPKRAAPTALHGQIMSALRASRLEANPQKRSAPTDAGGYSRAAFNRWLMKWVAAPALVALLAT